jgi:hypothetical protein
MTRKLPFTGDAVGKIDTAGKIASGDFADAPIARQRREHRGTIGRRRHEAEVLIQELGVFASEIETIATATRAKLTSLFLDRVRHSCDHGGLKATTLERTMRDFLAILQQTFSTCCPVSENDDQDGEPGDLDRMIRLSNELEQHALSQFISNDDLMAVQEVACSLLRADERLKKFQVKWDDLDSLLERLLPTGSLADPSVGELKETLEDMAGVARVLNARVAGVCEQLKAMGQNKKDAHATS